jgi:hypothetical protein
LNLFALSNMASILNQLSQSIKREGQGRLPVGQLR